MPSERAVPDTGGNRLRTRKTRMFIVLFLATAAGAACCIAQDKPDAPAPKQSDARSTQSSSTEKPQAPDKSKEAQEKDNQSQISGTSKDRLFFTLPNFLTLENANQVPPLTAGQKFKVVARSSFDYVQYPWYGFLAGISQAENSEPGYG